MKAVYKPKVLPWLAYRAGMPGHVVDTMWGQALALAGVGHAEAIEPCRQAEALQYLMRMLNRASSISACRTGRAGPTLAAAVQ